MIDGFPAGIRIDEEFVRQELARRRPGQSALTTGRQEADAVEFLSGIYEGVSTGCPIGFVVWNTNQHSADYDNMKDVFRPSHADFTYTQKYGIRDHRGGGRSSARETISRVVAGALAKLALKEIGVQITAFTSQVGTLALDKDYAQYDFGCIEGNLVRCPDPELARQMEELILRVKGEGDTIGGVVSCVIRGCPIGLGQPVFGKLHAALGNAMLSINRHPRRNQQRRRHLFPCSLQTRSDRPHGTAHGRQGGKRNRPESPRTPRPLRIATCRPHRRSHGGNDPTRLLFAG